MDYFRRAAVILVVLLPMLMLIGCGGDGDDDDDGRIAFQSGNPLSPGIFIMNDDGSNEQPVVGDGSDPALRSDGRVIAFARGRDIFAVVSNGTGEDNLTDNGLGVVASDPTYNEQSTLIAYVLTSTTPGADPAIRLMDTDGTDDEELVTNGSDPAFSPDGTQIVFVRDQNLFLINIDGTGLTPLTNNDSDDVVNSPSFSPTGNRVVFEFAESAMSTPSLQFIDVGNQMVSTLVADGEQPTFSPFGDRVAFVRDGAIFSIDVDGTDLQPLTTGTTDAEPDWSQR